MNLSSFQHIVINSSAGKDSQAMTHYVCGLAQHLGLLNRVVLVHADLGRVEWPGVRELAEEHARHYGVRFVAVRRDQGDLLAQVRARGMWPDSKNRYCTSDQKRDQVAKIIRHLSGRRVLNCLGFRKEESPARAKRQPFEINQRVSCRTRTVYDWLPIHDWTLSQVWECNRAAGTRHHYAYDLGMPRLSCCFCIFAPEEALLLAGRHNPALLDEYVATEKFTGHDFRHGFKIESIQKKIAAGAAPIGIPNWVM